jgi:hypothetical protein
MWTELERSGQSSVTGFCEQGTELSSSINGGKHQLSDYRFVKKESASIILTFQRTLLGRHSQGLLDGQRM